MFLGAAGLLAALIFAASSPALGQTSGPPAPSPEMQRLSNAIVGSYTVVETHHARPGAGEWTARGTASYASGPDGQSVVEHYQTSGPHGAFSAVAVLWWEAESGAYRHFQCESREPCGVTDNRGTWEGRALAFVRHVERQGRAIRFEERFDFSEPDKVLVTANFSVNGGESTRAMTIVYTRVKE